jgi:hypothetical protein
MALRSGTATPRQVAVQIAAAQPERAVPAETIRAPLPAEIVTPAAENDSRPAEAAPAQTGAAAGKTRPKAPKSAPGTPAKPAPKPVYSRD